MEKRPLDSFEFNCSISGTLLCEIGSTMAYVKDNDFLFNSCIASCELPS